MICLGLQFVLSVFVVCSYCGNDFVSLGRHSWRCKSRMMDNEPEMSSTSGHLNVEDRAVIANTQISILLWQKLQRNGKSKDAST